MRILVAEDERDLALILSQRLRREGYAVDVCHDGAETLDYLRLGTYDAAVVDILMPKLDGLTAVQTVRAEGNDTPVLFLTALDGVDDRVRGLDAGADDYLVKPFAMAELLARVRALLRRRGGAAGTVLTAADLTMDCAARSVCRGGRPIELSAREYALLEYLLRNKGIVLSRDQIERHIWSYDYDGSSNVVDVYIRYLRKKIDEDAALPLIRTVRGAGYVLREDGE